jgi:hypothetical protein
MTVLLAELLVDWMRSVWNVGTADGAHEWNRTIDLLLTKEVLYRLSYVSDVDVCVLPVNQCMAGAAMERETGIEPAPSAWKAEVLPLNYSRDMRNRLVEGGGFEPPKA